MHSAKATDLVSLDPAHETLDTFSQVITQDVWREKYAYHSLREKHPFDTFARVCRGIYQNDSAEHRDKALELMKAGIFMPGGRIIAGAGTAKHVTLMNCYVNDTLDDSMEGIADGVRNTMLTLRQGGGIGTDFSALRPTGAILKRLGDGAESSGAVSFMHIWDAASKTIMSAGARRGAMMATMICTHPDVLKFIRAKQTAGVLTQFNVSVLITDAFMDAIRNDEDWHLYFRQPPIGFGTGEGVRSFSDKDGVTQYIYHTMKARELWDMILKSTYEYAEPGVIFIDRVNKLNNLNYLENIQCTNPCGEQPLPPNGTCNLGAINLARLIRNPFAGDSYLDIKLLHHAVRVGVRFLDNVIDVTNYPLEQQRVEEHNKRRLGLGISGLANAIAMLGLRYGDESSVNFTREVMRLIAEEAYKTSALLAKERGAFPLYSTKPFMQAPFVRKLSDETQRFIRDHGIRNGVLLTIAPTGTTSLLYGNLSSGLEPVFAFHSKRKVVQPGGEYKVYDSYDYGYLLYHKCRDAVPGSIELPDYMVEADQITPKEHIAIQAVCQQWVDASISKTINCPSNLTYDAFKEVYWQAYEQGCKGCTTYRPSEVRGSVLEKASQSPQAPLAPDLNKAETIKPQEEFQPEVEGTPTNERPDVLKGVTYKIKWPNRESALYLTINESEGKPYEFFIASRTSEHQEWISSLTRMISAIMRQGIDITFAAQELQQISSSHDSAWVNGKHYNSLPAYIGYILEHHLKDDRPQGAVGKDWEPVATNLEVKLDPVVMVGKGLMCPKCQSPTLISREGCKTCTNCGFSNCG